MIVSPEIKPQPALPESATSNDLEVDPPAYAATVPGPSSSSSSVRRVNHLYINERTVAIKGHWTVDPTLRIPSILLPPMPEGKERLDNLHLVSKYSSVDAKITLSALGSDESSSTKAFLHCESETSIVKVAILERPKTVPFRLVAKSGTSNLTVRIPRDFVGPITYTNKDHCGSIVFSESIRDRLTMFSRVEDSGKAFIGEWVGSGYGESASDNKMSWPGDELELECGYSTIKLMYTDESSKPTEFALIWKDIVEAGPIEGIRKSIQRNVTRLMTPADETRRPLGETKD